MRFVKKIDSDKVRVARDAEFDLSRTEIEQRIENVQNRIIGLQNQITLNEKMLADWQTILTKF